METSPLEYMMRSRLEMQWRSNMQMETPMDMSTGLRLHDCVFPPGYRPIATTKHLLSAEKSLGKISEFVFATDSVVYDAEKLTDGLSLKPFANTVFILLGNSIGYVQADLDSPAVVIKTPPWPKSA